MKNMKLFSSKYCEDSTAMKAFLMKNNIEYTNMDITENLSYLRKFLKYRDTYPDFDKIKEKGSIGIPCLVIDDGEKLYFDHVDIDVEQLK